MGVSCVAFQPSRSPASLTLAGFCDLQAVTRKTRILDVAYNASNNELVRRRRGGGRSRRLAVGARAAGGLSALHGWLA